ncbi:MAG TPA: zinc ribbon domain-containing protein [Pyrinomonadaceae bacterium]|jgi:hypothetical protein|nr:zinc ribbon domain-containing protein [Pyrinomonadaceae bacterium]
MFCPRCGQEQISNETRFCSRCGFLMAGVGELIANAGNTALTSTGSAKPDTARKRGLKQGLFIFLLTFLVVPIVSILTIWANVEPFGVAISAILLFVGGLLRMAYAMLFESTEPTGKTIEQTVYQTAHGILNKKQDQNALPPQQSIPTSSYMPPTHGNWRDTNDLEPSSVTDHTTKLLQKDKQK